MEKSVLNLKSIHSQNTQLQILANNKDILKEHFTHLNPNQTFINDLSQTSFKSLFTLCYLLTLQLKKFVQLFNDFTRMSVNDLKDENIFVQKKEQISFSLQKFEKYFISHYQKLKKNEDYLRNNFSNDFGPKFSLCFIELSEIFENKIVLQDQELLQK